MTLRVLHVVDSLEPEAGSVAISLRGLPDALRARGVESETVWDRCQTGAACASGAGAFDRTMAGDVVESADIVHLHGWGHHLARTMAAAIHKTNRPYVISPIGTLCNGTYSRKRWRDQLRDLLVNNRFVRRAGAVTALNAQEERELRARRVHVNIVRLPYGINISDYGTSDSSSGTGAWDRPGNAGLARSSRSNGPPPGEEGPSHRDDRLESLSRRKARGPTEGRCLLMLGPVHPVEGFVPLLRALSELGPESNGWNVAIVGRQTGDWRKMLEAAVRRKGGEGRVMFAPAPDIPSQRAWLVHASLLAAPSLHVRCPVSIMQAVAAGVPVLASSRVVPPGLENVIRVCEPSRGELKAALRSLFGLGDEERAAMARRARRIGSALFDWSALVDQYVQLYKGLI